MKSKLLDNWKECQIGDICNIYQPKYITSRDLNPNGKYSVFGANGVIGKYDKYNHEKPEVLIGCRGTCGVVNLSKPFSWIIGNAMVVTPKNEHQNEIEKLYLYYFLKSSSFTNIISGTSQPQITREPLAKFKIILPPLSTQQKIISFLEKTEKLNEMRKEADELTKEYLKAIFMKMFGKIIFNKNTPTFPLKEILERIDSGTSPVCEQYPRTEPNQTAVLKLSSVTYGFFNPDENKLLPSETEIKKKVAVKKGDVLFSRKNTYNLVGATAYVFESDENLLLPDLIFKLVYKNDKINGIFLWKLFSDPTFKKRIGNLASGSSGSMPNISKERLMQFEIPIPSMKLQTKFAEIVKNIEYVKKYQKSESELIDNIINTLTQKVFKGELVC